MAKLWKTLYSERFHMSYFFKSAHLVFHAASVFLFGPCVTVLMNEWMCGESKGKQKKKKKKIKMEGKAKNEDE